MSDFKSLKLESIIGFGGSVHSGFHKHPDGIHTIYSLGSTVVIDEAKSKRPNSQEFLQGHTNVVSCLSVSKSGKYIASGQITHMGFQADIIIWDFATRTLLRRLTLHKVKVEALAFSPNDKYLASLGGQDDNSVIVWDLEKGAAICGSPASKDSAGVTLSLAYLNKDDNSFVTGGHSTLRVWELNATQRKIRATDCQTGQIKRIVKCITVDQDDEFMYCGTTTAFWTSKEKDLFSMGVLSVAISPQNDMVLVGCGDGGIAAMKLPSLKIVKDSSEVFATASMTDIRIWNAVTCQELLRIAVPNLECNCVTFKKDGSSLISGWNDGKIRAFGPQSGRLQYEIHDAHKRSVTALANCVWRRRWPSPCLENYPQVQTLEDAMKEHKGTVTCIKLRKNNLECVSSSSDGSCIIWDLTRYVRNQVLFAPSFFKAVSYYPDESQLLTSGTDRKVAYWEAFDGSLIRELEASQSDTINGLDIAANGKHFVIGGSDKLVKYTATKKGMSRISELGTAQTL
ncbi:WD40 repeat-like protein [Rhizoclosmatium globosum]|uniref:Cilia- and flagella-associated protein 52 n=1 Tax=Rhizoclosmatium globosum TaxID=329046 RepID=A0A1Y2D258_9FUNG|nr:WD40 repeat-like protein [Rhizoclosmatium globosum]|eukprot:ORY53214.1 WD40 repeat-like protein [Rhizoclosmatium globosum]